MDCSEYSRNKPKIKIKININEVKIKGKLNLLNIWIKGINSAISISKIRKIKLIIKNWILKGIRGGDIGSNPHSKGEIFSRSWKDFFEIK